MQRYFCAALDGLITGTSTVYMVKPGFIRCLLLLEVCRGSPEWFRIQPKHSLKEEFENLGHYYFLLRATYFLTVRPVFCPKKSSLVLNHIPQDQLVQDKAVCKFSLCNLVSFSQQMACAKCKFINLCCENVFTVYMSRCRDDSDGDVNMLKLLRSFVYSWASAAFLSWTQSPRIETVPSKSRLCHKQTKNNKPRL